MNGIMSGIEDRQDYNVGGGAGIQAENIRVSDLPFMKNEMPSARKEVSSAPSITNKEMSFDDRIQAAQDKYNRSRMNPIYKLAIQGGLRGMSERGGGSVAANLAKAFEGPTDELFKDLDAKNLMERDIEFKRAEIAEKSRQDLKDKGFELQKLTLQQDIKGGKYDEDIAILMEGGASRPEAIEEIKNRFFKNYGLDKSPEYYERESKKSRMKSFINTITDIQGRQILNDDTAMDLLNAIDSLPQEFKGDLDKSKYIIAPDAEITMNEDGSLQLSEQDKDEYGTNKIYFDLFNTGKFYRKQGNRLIPLATG